MGNLVVLLLAERAESECASFHSASEVDQPRLLKETFASVKNRLA